MNGKQFFSYSKSGNDLRRGIYVLFGLFLFDVPLHWVLTYLPAPWDLVSGYGLLALELLLIGVLVYTRRSRHFFDGKRVGIRFGLMCRTNIDASAIESCERYQGRVPFLTLLCDPVQEEDGDTLFVLGTSNANHLVVLTLKEERAVRLLRKRPPVRRLVLSLDQPEAFVTALSTFPEEERQETAEDNPHFVIRSISEKVAVELQNLSKRYGDFVAVQDISLSIRKGEIIGFLGSNGAGKTTTIRMMTGQLRPTSGDIRVNGASVWSEREQALRQIGYVPDSPMLYEGLTASQMLWFVGELYGLSHVESRERAAVLLATLGLTEARDRLVSTFSLGMKRKMSIAAALMHEPQILVLDEVTNGLDPKAAREVKDRIAWQAQQGTTVFLTTHILDVVEELADRIAIVERGRLLAVGTLDELREQCGRPGAHLEEIFLELTGRSEVTA